jgi:hypothetical protein
MLLCENEKKPLPKTSPWKLKPPHSFDLPYSDLKIKKIKKKVPWVLWNNALAIGEGQ